MIVSRRVPEGVERHFPALVESLVAEEDVVLVYLFGSRAGGRPGPLSDVDVAILLDPMPVDPLGRRLELLAISAAALGTDEVDLVVLNDADPTLAFQVHRYGRRLYSRRRTYEDGFAMSAVSRYLDTAALRARTVRTLRSYFSGSGT